MSMYFLKLCWKNIWRSQRRTFITVSAIGLGVMSMVFLRNYYDSFHQQLVSNVIRYQSGHLVISATDFQKHQQPNLYIKNVEPAFQWISHREEVAAASERVFVNGLLSASQGSSNIMYMGVDPAKERKVTEFSSNIIKGEYLKEGETKGIVIGKVLSEQLKVDVGSKVVALSQGIDGSIGNELFHVTGIFESQSDADKMLAFINISDARALTAIPPEGAHQITVILKDAGNIDKMRDAYLARFPNPSEELKSDSEILSWKEIQKHILAMMELEKAVNRLIMMVILFVAALGIANSILMNIMERTREFGVMMAIGTSRKEVVGMVVVETLLLCTVGVAIGNLLAMGLTTYFGHIGFDLKWLTSANIVLGGAIVQTVSYPSIVWMNSLVVTSLIFLLAVFASIIPARHISRLSPVKALRSL